MNLSVEWIKIYNELRKKYKLVVYISDTIHSEHGGRLGNSCCSYPWNHQVVIIDDKIKLTDMWNVELWHKVTSLAMALGYKFIENPIDNVYCFN